MFEKLETEHVTTEHVKQRHEGCLKDPTKTSKDEKHKVKVKIQQMRLMADQTLPTMIKKIVNMTTQQQKLFKIKL